MSSIHSQSQQAVAMDVDSPSGGGGGAGNGSGAPGTLKRCSSAPMINEANAAMTTTNGSSTSRDQQPCGSLFGTPHNRTRRFSASFSPVPGSPISGPRLTPRINQLRQEEHEGISNTRELAHEREIHHAMQISQSWEDLSLMNDNSSNSSCDWKPLNKTAPLQISLPSSYGSAFMCNSPSPTRTGFQSPTRSRTIIRRSASPVLRPSPLGVKRKLDEDRSEFCAGPRAKRVYSYSGGCISSLSSERGLGGLLTTSGGGVSGSGAPPLPPGSLSSAGTPESVSSAGGESPRSFARAGSAHAGGGGGATGDTPSPGGADHHMHHHHHHQLHQLQLHKDDHEMADSIA
ncbi:unnamed protein product [Callosobruchus maculatus]|uniref:Protein FAM122A n=1 Tax=Callosobruchus maculatus TaxID=64391 RepID=A0A653DQA6_CALMS|nr:unnamed protein product [Callosobruchus maculatus]